MSRSKTGGAYYKQYNAVMIEKARKRTRRAKHVKSGITGSLSEKFYKNKY